ncbi:MAG: hypothetical protein IMZ50_15565 [Candidatus Atribacteria bacterium]|nr:hypothetical protein [Candidatus Atribacteria bacterium]
MTIADDEINDHYTFYEPNDEDEPCTPTAAQNTDSNWSGNKTTGSDLIKVTPSLDATPPQPDPFQQAMQEEYDSQIPIHIDDADKSLIENVTRMLAKRQAEIDLNNSYTKKDNARLQHQIDSIISWKENDLRRAMERIEQGQKNRSYRTRWGVVGFRKRTDAKVTWTDKDAVVAWCQENLPAALSWSEPRATPLKTPLAQAVADGLHPPVMIEEPGDDFYIKTSAAPDPPASVAGDEIPFDE